MTFYLDLEDALEQVKFLGFHVKDIGLLDSALSRPKTTVFGDDQSRLTHALHDQKPFIGGRQQKNKLVVVRLVHCGKRAPSQHD